MADDALKLDVRVRERLMKRGVLKDSEISRHLEGLADVGEQAAPVVAKQPALQSESDRDIVIVRTSGVRQPLVAPRRDEDLESTPIDDEDDLDDDLEDEDEDEDEGEAAKKPVAEKPAAEKPADSGGDEARPAQEAGNKNVDDDWGDQST